MRTNLVARRSERISRGLYALLLSAVGTVVTIAAAPPADAAVTVPLAGQSRYINNSGGNDVVSLTNNNAAYRLGCQMGSLDAGRTGTQKDFAALEFGALIKQSDGSYRASLYSATNQTLAGVLRIAENWSWGYWNCTGADSLSTTTVALITNNDLDGISSAAGAAWGARCS